MSDTSSFLADSAIEHSLLTDWTTIRKCVGRGFFNQSVQFTTLSNFVFPEQGRRISRPKIQRNKQMLGIKNARTKIITLIASIFTASNQSDLARESGNISASIGPGEGWNLFITYATAFQCSWKGTQSRRHRKLYSVPNLWTTLQRAGRITTHPTLQELRLQEVEAY